MFKTTTVTLTLAAIATVAVNMQAPAFAAEPSTDPIVTETPALPGSGSFTMSPPSFEDALADYLAGLGPEEDDFGGPAELVVLPDDVLDAITNPMVDLPGVGELPPLTADDTEPPIDEPACGEPGGICDGPDEGAELPLDPTDVCGDEGVACDFDPSADESEAHPWDVPLGDDEEAPFDDHDWVEPDHGDASYAAATGTDSGAVATENVTTTTVTGDASTITDSNDVAVSATDEVVGDDAAPLASPATEGTDGGIDPAVVAVAGILAMMAIAGIGYGAFRMGHNRG